MKHQVVLVGGQLLPICIGIKEFEPDQVFLIVSKESRTRAALLKSMFPAVHFIERNCDAYDLHGLKEKYVEIIEGLDPISNVSFNLTGGTKIMMLAAYSVLHERNKSGFYINQDNTLTEFPSLEKRKILSEFSISEFMSLSGHNNYIGKKLSDYNEHDLNAAKAIDTFASNDFKKYSSIANFFRKKYPTNEDIPDHGGVEISNGITCNWTQAEVQIKSKGKDLFRFKSSKIRDLFFKAGWWELIVAHEIAKWSKVKEQLVQFELAFRTDKGVKKNEIDILINLGSKLIFVECKSGHVRQEDINKMRVIKETYGGVISKSILVTRFLPNPMIIEKCKELDVEVFCCYAFKQNDNSALKKLIPKLEELERKLFT
jgi:hypothetical protein